MSARQAESDILHRSRVVAIQLEAEELLARGLQAYAEDPPFATDCFEQVVRLTQNEGLTDLVCQAAACLGMLQIEQDDFMAASIWFDRAQSDLASSDRLTTSPLLPTLIGIAQAQAVVHEVDRQLAQTQAQVRQELGLLKAQAQVVMSHLLQEMMKGPVYSNSNRAPVSRYATFPSADSQSLPVVQLLGLFEAHLTGGGVIRLCSNRKGQALFKVLATHPYDHYHKEKLLLLFWPNENPAVVTGKLHIAASRLRRALLQAGLGGDALLFEEDCYCLNRKLQVQSDVVLFDMHFKAGQRLEARNDPDQAAAEYEAALALYRGPYLAEVVGEDWPLLERARLEEQFQVILTKLAAWYFTNSRWAESAECCRRALDCDSLREDIYRQLMRCLSHQGQRNQALRVYQNCSRVLQEELGIEPMRETTQLFDQIQGQTV